MRITVWISDVCSSDLIGHCPAAVGTSDRRHLILRKRSRRDRRQQQVNAQSRNHGVLPVGAATAGCGGTSALSFASSSATQAVTGKRSEEHTSELQSLMRISYADFCLTTQKQAIIIIQPTTI